MKKLFTFLLALIASVGIASAQNGTCGDNLTWELNTETGDLTISGTGAMADYAYVSKTPWYGHRSAIKTVLINDGVTSIGGYAFGGCSSLTSITIPNGVTSIGSRAFSYCSSLTSVTIPNSVTSIGNYAFYDCSSLTSVTIGESVTSIGGGAFSRCFSLTSITIPNSVTSIGGDAFSNVKNIVYHGTATGSPWGAKSVNGYVENHLVYVDETKKVLLACFTSAQGEIIIPNSVTSIGGCAFLFCSSLTSVTIPNSVTSIGMEAFIYCSSLKSIIVESGNTVYDSRENCNAIIETATNTLIVGCQNTIIPNSVTSIGERAFRGCSSLTSVTIPNSVTSIGFSAFYDCTSLTSITIPNSVTSIGDAAFYDCTSLTSITIPNSVTSIGDQAFRGCSSLTSVTIPNSVTSIGGGAFYECSSLTSITIPNSVTSIDKSTFSGCSSLTSVTIPNSVTSIENYTFSGCSSLISITIPNSVTSIGKWAFNGCSSLTSVTFEGSTPPVFSEDVFYLANNCPIYVPCGTKDAYVAALNENNTIDESRVIETVIASGYCGADSTNLTWELSCDSVLTISGTGEMRNYPTRDSVPWFISELRLSIRTVIIEEGVTNIGNRVFHDCSNIESISIPNSVTKIGSFAFTYCWALDSIVLPDSLISIGEGAFVDCHNLKSIDFPDGLVSIGANCFMYCARLSSVTIPASVSYISTPFRDCKNLTSIFVNPNNSKYDSRNNCNAIIVSATNSLVVGCKTTTIPENVTNIYHFAFANCKTLTSVIIPQSVTTIGRYAFSDCDSLKNITCYAMTPPIVDSTSFDKVNKNIPLYVLASSVDLYKSADGWKEFTNILPIKCLLASGYCGADSTNLTWELSCDGVLTISGTGAMADYTSASKTPWYGHRSAIKTILINDGVTSIGDNAFCYCISLTSVTIGNSITSIGNSAFSDCWSLDALQLPESVTSIGNSAFAGCFRLRNVHIPKNVSSIGTRLFQYCSKLVSITVDTENPIYDSRDNCNAIIETSTNVLVEGSNATHIPETVVAIGKSAFANKNGFRQIDIPNSITSIGEDAFINCDTLESLVVPTSVSYMGRSAFYQCSGLKTVEFKSVTPPNIDNRYMGGTCFLGTTCDFLVPCGTKEAYVIALNYQSVSDSIDESRVIESEELMFDYTISSDNTLGSVTITQEPTCTEPLIFRADAAEGYQFTQWSDGNTDNPRSLILTQDTTLKAEFELCTYIVTWLNYDSLVLELDTNVAYGTMPSYDSILPAKPSTAEYTYTFAGWSPVVESVTGNTTYIAVFDEVLNAYTVTWLNYDSLVLELDTNVIYGTMPSYDSAVPAKPSTAEYTYTFAGWSPEVVATTEDATYTATYTSALRTYSVLVYGMNDNIILNGTYPYGESILVEAIPEQNYQFAQWSDGNTDNPRSLILTQDTVLKALFEQIIIEQDTIIVTDSTDISDIITGGQDTIPHVEVQPGGEITIDRDDIGIGVITIITIGTESGQVHPWDGGYDNLKNTRVVMEYVLEPLKQQADPNKWYAFAVPFEVDIETGVTRKYGNKSHVPGKDFMILEYDSELRSRTGSGWKEKKSGLLEPGHFYMLGIEGNCNRWLFEKVRDADVVGDKEKDLQHYAHGNSKNNGWHGLGNTTLEYVDMSFDGLNATYVYIYDNQYGKYNIYSIEELILAVGQPFFTQGDNDGSVAFTPNNGKGKGNGKKNMPIYAPSYDVQPSHPRVLLTIETEKINATPDRLYITLHDDNQCGSYRIGRDFMRMDKGSKQVPNFWCPMADGTQLSAHGVTMPTTYTTIPLGIFTPAKGEYTINAHMQDMDDYIVELYCQNVCLGIVMQGVPFRLEMAAGTSYDYSIRISRRVSTDLNPAEDTQCDKDNKWYDVLGRPLPQDAHGIFIRKGEKIIK